MADPLGPNRRQVLRLTALSGLGLAFGAQMARVLVGEGRLHEVRATRSRLGTLVTMTAIHEEQAAAAEVVEAGFTEIDRLELILNRHRSESALSVLNREGGVDQAPAELLHVLQVALEVARAKVDYRRVQISGPAIQLNDTQLTLDGVAKGYVVDKAVAAMMFAGADRVLVDAGGDIATGGSVAPQGPFEVDIADPRHSDRRIGSAQLAGTAVATSGDYVQRFGPGFGRHHIIDPRTGRPANTLSSVTVLASTAMAADALSTAVFVMGPENGVEFLKSRNRVEGLLVSKAGAVSRTPGWRV